MWTSSTREERSPLAPSVPTAHAGVRSCLAPEVGLDDARVARGPRRRPSAIVSPWSSTVTWSEMPMTTLMSCSISRTEIRARSRSLLDQLGAAPRSPAGSCRRSARRAAAASARGQGARDLQPALVAVGQVLRELVGGAVEADELRAARVPLLVAAFSSRRTSGVRRIMPREARLHARVHADHARCRGPSSSEQADVLEGPGDAERASRGAAAWPVMSLPSKSTVPVVGS